jgi:siderophore synthetase component
MGNSWRFTIIIRDWRALNFCCSRNKYQDTFKKWFIEARKCTDSITRVRYYIEWVIHSWRRIIRQVTAQAVYDDHNWWMWVREIDSTFKDFKNLSKEFCAIRTGMPFRTQVILSICHRCLQASKNRTYDPHRYPWS